MSREQLRHVRWAGIGVLAVGLTVGVLVWQLVYAQTPPDVTLQRTEEAKAVSDDERERNLPPLPAYNLSAIDADPTYYAQADRRRLWQTAPLPKGIKYPPELEIKGDVYIYALPNQKLPKPLVVKVRPGRPVTFYAPDDGTFSNGEGTITIKADANGLAQTEFTTKGEGPYRIWVGSPENRGPAEFQVFCMSAKDLDDMRSGAMARRHEQVMEEAEAVRVRDDAVVRQQIEAAKAVSRSNLEARRAIKVPASK